MTKNITKFKKISVILNRKHDKAHDDANDNEVETNYTFDQAGLFEEASDGTLFLDELNSMSLNMQAKLLRAIETKK